MGHILVGVFAMRNASHFGGPPVDYFTVEWPSGAAAMAAHLAGAAPRADGDDRRVIVISGGNLDLGRFAEILAD